MLIEAKSNLARLMATENLIIEQRNVPTAFFDIQSRVLTVPILNGNLSNYLYDLLLGHEVGHALETPAEGWHDSVVKHKVNKSILNVCEDVRIEKKIKRRFPGLKPSFLRGYNELVEMDFFEVKGKDLNTLNFIDRVNLYTKGGPTQGIEFTEEETKLLREIESTETWKEVVAIAQKVQSFMKEELEKTKEEKGKIKIRITSSEDVGEETKSLSLEELQELEDDGVEFEFVDEDKIGKEGDLDEDKEGTSEVENKSLHQQDGGDEASLGASEEEKLESETDKAFREREKELYNTNDKSEFIYSNIPKVSTKSIIISHKEILKEFRDYSKKIGDVNTDIRKNFIKFKNESNKVVSYLVKEFELRKNATQQNRAKISKTGELNMSRIHEYKITDDIFERLTKIPNGKSHGLVMFIDWSGSMQDKIHATVKQLLNLVMFCKKVNIPFDVYAFTTQWDSEDEYYVGTKKIKMPIQKPIVGDICLNDGFHLLNLFNHKMTASEYVEMASNLLGLYVDRESTYTNSPIPLGLRLGGTPLNHTIVAAFEIIPDFKETNKVDIVNSVFLTDGESGSLGSRYAYYDTNKVLRHEDIRPGSKRRQVFRDKVTKATVEVQRGYGYNNQSAEETTALLKLLKQRANCNLMGFYIAGSRDIRSALDTFASITNRELDFIGRREYVEKQMIVFRKEKTHIIENVGYDEYYLIGSSSLDTDDDELEIKSNTTRGLVSAFSKYTGGKVSSRIILNRFIKLIA